MRKRRKNIKKIVLSIRIFSALLIVFGVFFGAYIISEKEEVTTEQKIVYEEEISEITKEPTEISMDEDEIMDNTETTEDVSGVVETETIEVFEEYEPQNDLKQEIYEVMENMTLEEKIAQMFMVTPEALTGYDSVTQASNLTKSALEEYPVGGIILMGNNIVSEEQIKKMTGNLQEYAMEISELPLFIGVDEEGGQVARIGNNSNFPVERFPDMNQIGAKNDLEQAYRVGDVIGSYLSTYGFNLDFAPVADVLSNQENQVVKRRSFGNDPKLVSAMDLEVMNGLQKHNVFACMKHFPGHGGTAGDTHQGYSYTEKTLDEMKEFDLVPFQKAIEEGVSFIMISHISLPNGLEEDVPASLSYEVVTKLLRDEMGYEGITITDAMNMGAVTENYTSNEATIRSVEAGIDIVLMPKDFKMSYNALLEAVNSGRIDEKRIDESVERILMVKKQWNMP